MRDLMEAQRRRNKMWLYPTATIWYFSMATCFLGAAIWYLADARFYYIFLWHPRASVVSNLISRHPKQLRCCSFWNFFNTSYACKFLLLFVAASYCILQGCCDPSIYQPSCYYRYLDSHVFWIEETAELYGRKVWFNDSIFGIKTESAATIIYFQHACLLFMLFINEMRIDMQTLSWYTGGICIKWTLHIQTSTQTYVFTYIYIYMNKNSYCHRCLQT